jgi:hypothetical protein
MTLDEGQLRSVAPSVPPSRCRCRLRAAVPPRRISPRLVTELLDWTGPRVAGMLRRQDPQARTAQVSWAGTSPVPVWLDQAREVSEQWIHRQQGAAGARPPQRPAPRPGRAGARRAALGLPLPPRAVLRRARRHRDDRHLGPVTRTWQLVATAAGWDYRDEPGARGVARLSLTTEQACRLLTSNLPQPSGRARLTASDDNATTGILLRTRAIIGSPR